MTTFRTGNHVMAVDAYGVVREGAVFDYSVLNDEYNVYLPDLDVYRVFQAKQLRMAYPFEIMGVRDE